MYNLSIQANTELRFILINIILNIFIMKLWWGFSDRRMKPKDIWHICISSLSSLLFPPLLSLYCSLHTGSGVWCRRGIVWDCPARLGQRMSEYVWRICSVDHGTPRQWQGQSCPAGGARNSLARAQNTCSCGRSVYVSVYVIEWLRVTKWEWSMMWVNTVLAHLRLLVKVTYFYKWPFLV